MTVIQDGEARHYQGDAEVENEEAEEQRFSTLEKKIRALEKSKKSVLELQKKMKRGIEMDPQQQAPCFSLELRALPCSTQPVEGDCAASRCQRCSAPP